jgi:TonB family protein
MTLRTRLTFRLLLLTILAVLALGKRVFGQTAGAPGPSAAAPPAAAAALTPPRLVTGAEATYPEAAKAAGKEATVDLEITLDAAGKPTGVRVAVPAGDGFDEAAVAAAQNFVFEPARRGDTPIPSRIRYRYTFKLPPPPPPPPTKGALEGRVLLRGGDDRVVGAAVTVTSEDGTITRIGQTESDGSFSFGDLPGGRYRVRVAGQDLAAMDSREEVTPGDATSVTYHVEPAAPAAAPGEAPLEFGATATVEAPPREVTKRTLSADELLNAAGTRGDPLRAIEYMPGVGRSPVGDAIIIRGSAPADSEVEFEGAPVFRLYHFGGLTSFVQPRLLERIDLYPGNFSVRYGRKMGGIVDVGVRDPRTDGYHAMADVNVIDASVLAEGPIGKHGSIAIAAKRSYIDFFFANLMPADIGVTAAPVYYDYQVIATYRPSDRDKLRVMLYGSADSFKLTLKNPDDSDPTVRGDLNEHSVFHRGQIFWLHKYSDRLEHEISVTAGPLSFGQDAGPNLTYNVPGFDGFMRSELRARLGDRVRLMGGLDLFEFWIDHGNYTGPAVQQIDGNPNAFGAFTGQQSYTIDRTIGIFRPAAYVEAVVQPTDRWQLVPGLRTDYFADIQRWALDPRLTTRYQVGATTALKGGVGQFSQGPDFTEVLPVIGNPHLRAPVAQHYSLGVEQKVGERLTLTAEGFYKRLRLLTVNSPVPGENLNNDGIGRIWGGEFSARLLPSHRTTGFVSYTLSRSERNDHGQEWRLFDWDQTHILTVSSSVRLGRGWDLGGTFRYVTGNPMTPVVDSTYNANTDTYRPSYGGVNTARNPAFNRLDLRVEKQWKVGNHGASMATYLDVQNVYNRRASEGQTYNYNFTQSEAIPGLPVIPSIGVRGEI